MAELNLQTEVVILTVSDGEIEATLLEAADLLGENPAWLVELPEEFNEVYGSRLSLNEVRRVITAIKRSKID